MALTVLLGGARSGKSGIAVALAAAQPAAVTFIATAEARDDEMRDRIERHRRERRDGWHTIEEPIDLSGALHQCPPEGFVIVDCLTLWTTNAEGRHGEAWVLAEAGRAIQAACERPGMTVVVSNEVGSGIVPIDADTRRWRDLLGLVNATFARAAGVAALCVAGRVLVLGDARSLLDA